MNKKFSTLLAGLLLAGGAFSNAWAEDLNALVNNGKYYKIVRTANKSKDGWSNDRKGSAAKYYLLENGVAAVGEEGACYWTIVKNEDGTYSLKNFNGDLLSVGTTTSFAGLSYRATPEEFTGYESEEGEEMEATLLVAGANQWLGNTGTPEDDVYPFELKGLTISGGSLDGFDIVEGSDTYGDVTDGLFELLDGDKLISSTIRFVYNQGNGYQSTNIFKVSYDKNTKTFAFANNESGDALIATGTSAHVDKFILEKDDLHGVYLQDATSHKFVKLTVDENGVVTAAELVDSKVNATPLAFEVTKDRVPVPVRVLNYYEQDGFSVEITCDKDEKGSWDYDELNGNPFVGHLTPMTFDWYTAGGNDKEGKFVEANKDAVEFYLKNDEGEFIVAVPYDVETAKPTESLYNFTTVSESELIHNLKRVWAGLEDQKYYGRFVASVDEAAWDKDATKIDEITWLQVKVNPFNGSSIDNFATVGRADIKTVPTLVAAKDNSTLLNGTDLKPILISLGSGQVVKREDLLQAKFFTVEKYDAKGEKLVGKLTATSYYGETDWRSSYGNVLEGQFALTVEGDYYVFTNRETQSCVWNEIPVNALYVTDKDNTYKWGNNIYVIKPVDKVNEADGYKRFSDSALNRQYHIAFSSSVFDAKAYLTENHDADDANAKNAHFIGLDTDRSNGLVFNIKKYNAARDLEDEQSDHSYKYHPTDSIYVISKLGYYNSKKEYKTVSDTLKVVSYSFVNQFIEPLTNNYSEGKIENEEAYYSKVYANADKKEKFASVAKAHESARRFAVRYDNGSDEVYNLRPIYNTKPAFSETEYKDNTKTSADLYQEFTKKDGEYSYSIYSGDKMYAGDATIGILNNTGLYDRTENDLFVIEETESEVYRRLQNEVDTVSIYRNDNEKSLLYEKTTEVTKDLIVNFLGMENIADFTKMAPAMIADTAYVRYETYKPQYMLVVDPTIVPDGMWCEEHQSATCEHAVPTKGWVSGRYLVNLVDSAKAWDDANKHQLGNPYKNTESYYKLGFVQATHKNDTLAIARAEATENDSIFVGDNENNIAKFQFRYVDNETGSFVIETSLDGTETPGYLKWMNGVVVVVDNIKNADIYNINEEEGRTPTANDAISASEVSVVATQGAVIVKGAAGKKVAISNILGQTVANTVIASDSETIAAPAGIVVVAVEGEDAVKVVVK